MGANTVAIYADDTTSGTIAISRSDSREVVLRNIGPDRAFFSFNGAVSSDSNGLYGVYIDADEWVTFKGLKCDSDIYVGCNSGESATLMGEIK
jgi:hypothetical protein